LGIFSREEIEATPRQKTGTKRRKKPKRDRRLIRGRGKRGRI
jgi:hypothetical protein